mmetsp:Transcript_21830/g.40165  ORF Transcript_21830/g.40165 Transcript_21830/m.40165 type:complete len:269 (+) Transcript_21830:185-991(+)
MVRPTDAGSTGVPGNGVRYGRHCFFFGAAAFFALARSMITSPSSPRGRCFMQSIMEHKLQAVALLALDTSSTFVTSTTSSPDGPSSPMSTAGTAVELDAGAAAALAPCRGGLPLPSPSSSESDTLSKRAGSPPASLGAIVEVSSCCRAAAAADDEEAAPPAAALRPALGSWLYADLAKLPFVGGSPGWAGAPALQSSPAKSALEAAAVRTSSCADLPLTEDAATEAAAAESKGAPSDCCGCGTALNVTVMVYSVSGCKFRTSCVSRAP